MFPQVCLFLLILIKCHGYQSSCCYDYNRYKIPQVVMVDVVNNLALKLLAIHNEGNDNNIAISPYGALSVIVALKEGVRGSAETEIYRAAGIPSDLSVIRVGLRDIHRHLKSYFIPEEGFLSGMTLSHDNVSLNREYEDILRFYGFDIDSFNNGIYPDFTTTESGVTNTELSTTNAVDMSTSEGVTSTTEEVTSTTERVTSTTEEVTSTETMSGKEENGDIMSTEKITTTTPELSTPAVTTTTEIMSTTTESVRLTRSEATSVVTETSTITTTETEMLPTSTTTTPTTTVVTPTTVKESTESNVETTGSETTVKNAMTTEMTTTNVREESTVSDKTTTTTESLTTVADTETTTVKSVDLSTTEEKSDDSTTLASSTETTKQSETTEIETTSETMSTTIIDSTTNLMENYGTTTVVDESTNNDTTKRSTRSVVDYIIARYYDDRVVTQRPPPYNSESDLYFLINGKYKETNINYMTYDTVLPFHYISHLNTLALRFPLDSSKYYLLLLLPEHPQQVNKLICDLRLNSSLKYIIDNLRYTHVKAIIPSFMLKGYVILTPTFQKMGINQVFEPRQADFSPMTTDRGIYVTNIEQAITVNIRNYVDLATMNNNRYLHQSKPVLFKADHPFLYFVIDSEIDVTLMAGKIVNPLNSRIR